MQDRNIGEGFRSAGDRDIQMTERDLICCVGYRLIGGCTRATDAERLDPLGQKGKKRHLTGDVGREHRRNHGAEHERLNLLTVEVGSLKQLRNAELAKIYRRDRLECSARLCKRRPHTSNYSDAAPVPECSHAGNIDGRRLSF